MAGGRLGGVAGGLRTLMGSGAVGGLADARLLERFAADRDEAAFAALVDRHGPMVRAVCRGVARCPHAAEDAFQATFLVLARKAGSLRPGGSLAGWLHRVAGRVAVRANRSEARRRSVEGRAAGERLRADRGGVGRELLEALHEEIGRLPEKYRSPVVLCDLQAMTREQAAGRLGWPAGTVGGRLARGRDLLRSRLIRRGAAPSVGLAALLAAAGETSAAVPTAWAAAAVGAAAGAAAGRSVSVAAGTVSAAALALSEGVMRTLFWSQVWRGVTAALAVVLASTALIAAAALAQPQPQAESQPKAEPQPQPQPLPQPTPRPKPDPKPEPVDATVSVRGVVVNADGLPAAGVRVYASLGVGASKPWDPVVAEATTDAGGRFALDVPATGGGRPGPQAGTVWAYRPGRLVGSRPISDELTPPGLPLWLALGPPARTLFEVRGPDGKPVAGATIMPRVLARDFCVVPFGLGDQIGAETRTDARGRAVMTAFLPEEVATAFVTAAGLGSQQFGFTEHDLRGIATIDPRTKVIDLLPVGRVRGRLVGDAAVIKGRGLTIMTSAPYPLFPWPGLVHATTDDQGRFEVPDVVAGRLEVHFSEPDPLASDYVDSPKGLYVEAGKTTEVDLRLDNAVPVYGFVRERGTGKPIEGVGVAFDLGFRRPLTTDAAGRYDGFVKPGSVILRLTAVPEEYAEHLFMIARRVPSGGVGRHELAPIELSAAGEIRGVVEDGEGRGVAGARVVATWTVDEGPLRQLPRETAVRADAAGAFRVGSVRLGVEATLTASHVELRTPRSVAARVGAGEPVRLGLNASRAAAMTGRVVDGQGKPLAGARVHLRSATRYPTGQLNRDDLVEFDGPNVLTTDAEGRYRTLRQLDREGEYAAYASAEGLGSDRTPWVAGGSTTFPDVTLRPEPKD